MLVVQLLQFLAIIFPLTSATGLSDKTVDKRFLRQGKNRNLLFDPKTVVVKEFHCPLKPPSQNSLEWGGWEYDATVAKTYHIVASAHRGIYELIGPGKSLIDVGAGLGQMKVGFDRINANVRYIGFDGGANVMDLEGQKMPLKNDEEHVVPHLCWGDFSKPVYLDEKFDVVLSIEVAEHIPKEGEAAFMDNLRRLMKDDGMIILTWGHPGQGGFHHVNEQSKEYVIPKMEERGLKFDAALTEKLGSNIAKAYAVNLMIFHL